MIFGGKKRQLEQVLGERVEWYRDEEVATGVGRREMPERMAKWLPMWGIWVGEGKGKMDRLPVMGSSVIWLA